GSPPSSPGTHAGVCVSPPCRPFVLTRASLYYARLSKPELVLGLAALIVLTLVAIADRPLPTAYLRLAEAQDASDTRERISLAPAEHDAVLAEMRTILKSLNRIMHGLAAGDLAMVEEAARASGTKAALNAELEKKLPPQFQQLERRVHQRFDQLA